ncbi:minor tail protein [Microbacterium phage Huwbert]|nr:minor tail protein [Microbacterium phage Huwbert]
MANEGIELEIYHYSDWKTLKGRLPGRKNPAALTELKGVGGGSFTIRRADPKLTKDPTLLKGRNICKVLVDREVVGAFLIGDRSSTIVSSGERSELTYTLAGAGLKQLFDDAIVEAFGGTTQFSGDKRFFNFATERGTWYNSSQWIAPTVYNKWGTGIWGGFPEKWPEVAKAQSYWIGPGAYAPSMTKGRWYARLEFPIATAGKYAIYSAVDNQFTMYVDGQQKAATKDGGSWKDTTKVEHEFTAGNHIIAYEVDNFDGPTALLMAVTLVVDKDNEILNTTSNNAINWKVLPFPTKAPGWSPGEVLGDLITEANSRGVLFPSMLTKTFTDTVDSNGVPWPDDTFIDWDFTVGESMLSVINKLEESTVDIWIDPKDYKLYMIPQRGVDRTVFTFSGQTATATPIEFKLGKHLREASTKSKAKIKNALLLKTVDGFISLENGPSKNIYGRLETIVDTGVSASLAADIAMSIFAQRAKEEEGASYNLLTREYIPFVHFNVGDLVLAPNEFGESVPRRVMSISIAESDAGQPLYTIEFDVIFRDNDDRINKALDKLGMGGVGSSSPNTGGSTPGVGGPIIFPPSTPDPNQNLRTPKAPTDLVVTSEGAWSPNGVTPIGIVKLDWTAVTQDINNAAMTPNWYNVEGQLFEPFVDGEGNTSYEALVGPEDFGRVTESEMSLQPFEPGSVWKFRVRAGDDGAWSDWTPDVQHIPEGPSTPMPPPNSPVVTSHRGTMSVAWDGMMGDFQPPPQFRYVYAEVSAAESGPWNRVSTVLFRNGGTIPIPQFSVGTALWVHLIAVDGVGIESQPSNPVQHTITGISGPDIEANSVDANRLIAGSVKTNHLSPEVGSQLNIEGNVQIIATKNQINGVAGELDATNDNLAEMQTYYDFGPTGAVISSPGSVFATAVRSDRIEMLENGNVISYWNSGQMYVNQLIGQRVTLGRHQIEQFDANGTVVRAL